MDEKITSLPGNNIVIIYIFPSIMKIVLFEKGEVIIKRKKAQPSRDYSTIGNKDNKVQLIFEDGKVYLKVSNPKTGLVYIYSHIKDYTNPDVNQTNAKGVHAILLVTTLKKEPSPYVFIFGEEGVAALFYANLVLAAKAAKEDNVSESDSDDLEDLLEANENDSDDSEDEDDIFTATQDFNVGARALAQELLASYK